MEQSSSSSSSSPPPPPQQQQQQQQEQQEQHEKKPEQSNNEINNNKSIISVSLHPLIDQNSNNPQSSSSPSSQPQPNQSQQSPSNSKPAHVRRPNWTTSEDEQLCRSWLENSLDPITNTIQKGTQFWHRVSLDFSNRGPGHIERNKDHVRNRWQLLQAKVIKFSSCFSRVQASSPIGKTQDELVADAMRMYEREEAHKFTFYSSWLILKNSHRWIQWSSNVGNKRLSTSGLPQQMISDIAVSPHSTVSLLDSDESPTLEQPLNRLLSSRKLSINSISNNHKSQLQSSSGASTSFNLNENLLSHHHQQQQQQDQKQRQQFQHQQLGQLSSSDRSQSIIQDLHPQLHPQSNPKQQRSSSLKFQEPDLSFSTSSSTTTGGMTTIEHHHQTEEDEEQQRSSERLLALAMKRKADVQEAALEVQLLSIDPEKITDPLRKEVYMMKMEEIRDRYKAKRSRSSVNEQSSLKDFQQGSVQTQSQKSNHNVDHSQREQQKHYNNHSQGLMLSSSSQTQDGLNPSSRDLLVTTTSNDSPLLQPQVSNNSSNIIINNNNNRSSQSQLTPPQSSPNHQNHQHQQSHNQQQLNSSSNHHSIDHSTTHPDLLTQNDLTVVYHTPPPQ